MFRFLSIPCLLALASCGMGDMTSTSAMDHDAMAQSDVSTTDSATAEVAATTDAASDSGPDEVDTNLACSPSKIATSKSGNVQAQLCGETTVPAGKPASLSVTLTDKASGKPLEGKDLQVSYVHTSMGHPSQKVPSATESAPGVYTLEGLQAGMSGGWTLTIGFDNDSVAFKITVQ